MSFSPLPLSPSSDPPPSPSSDSPPSPSSDPSHSLSSFSPVPPSASSPSSSPSSTPPSSSSLSSHSSPSPSSLTSSSLSLPPPSSHSSDTLKYIESHTITENDIRICSAIFASHLPHLLFYAKFSGSIHVFDTLSYAKVASLRGHKRPVFAMTTSADVCGSPLLLSASYDNTLRMWNLKEMRCDVVVTHIVGNIYDLLIAKVSANFASFAPPSDDVRHHTCSLSSSPSSSSSSPSFCSTCSLSPSPSSPSLLSPSLTAGEKESASLLRVILSNFAERTSHQTHSRGSGSTSGKDPILFFGCQDTFVKALNLRVILGLLKESKGHDGCRESHGRTIGEGKEGREGEGKRKEGGEGGGIWRPKEVTMATLQVNFVRSHTSHTRSHVTRTLIHTSAHAHICTPTFTHSHAHSFMRLHTHTSAHTHSYIQHTQCIHISSSLILTFI